MALERTAETMATPFGEFTANVWKSAEYIVGLYAFQGIFRLTIQRADAGASPFSWDELMQIKRECGFGDHDCVEVYPRDCDIVNTANLRHLYIMSTPLTFAMRAQPFGALKGK